MPADDNQIETLHVEALQKIWNEDFPIAQAMQVRIVQYDGATLTTHAPLHGNTNVHGSAFAGSLYALQALTAWGVIYLQLAELGSQASIIHARGEIDFAKPITHDIETTCRFDPTIDLRGELESRGRSRFSLQSQVYSAGEIASEFTGVYVVREASN